MSIYVVLRKVKIILSLLIAILLLMTVYYKYSKVKNTCDYWDKGINGL